VIEHSVSTGGTVRCLKFAVHPALSVTRVYFFDGCRWTHIGAVFRTPNPEPIAPGCPVQDWRLLSSSLLCYSTRQQAPIGFGVASSPDVLCGTDAKRRCHVEVFATQ
jgi:hypothetical protein